MKKFTKICLIISLVFLLLGVICFTAGTVIAGGFTQVHQMVDRGDLSIGQVGINGGRNYKTEDFKDKEINEIRSEADNCRTFTEKEAAVSDLEFDVRAGEIIFTDSQTENTDNIEIDIIGSNAEYTFENKDGTLIFKEEKGAANRNYENTKITVSIPNGKIFREAEIDTGAGNVVLEHCLAAKNLEISVGAGNITADKIAADGDCDITAGAGQVVINQLTAEGDCDISVGVGQIEIKEFSSGINGKVETECGVGQIILNGKRYNHSNHQKIDSHYHTETM